MNGLARLQAAFQAHVMSGDGAVTGSIVGDDRAPAERRLQVYFDAYRLRLLEVLRNDFSGLLALVGDDDWASLGLGYLDEHPSTDPSVRWFGRDLPGFLQRRSPWRERAELAEMAAFEWAWGQAFDAADRETLPAETLAAIKPDDWPGLTLRLHPSLQTLALRWNVPAMFGAVTRGDDLPVPTEAAHTADWVVWRRNLTVYWRSLPADERWALDAAAGGAGFAELCDGLCRWHADDAVPQRAIELLGQWFADGLIVGIGAAAPTV